MSFLLSTHDPKFVFVIHRDNSDYHQCICEVETRILPQCVSLYTDLESDLPFGCPSWRDPNVCLQMYTSPYLYSGHSDWVLEHFTIYVGFYHPE